VSERLLIAIKLSEKPRILCNPKLSPKIKPNEKKTLFISPSYNISIPVSSKKFNSDISSEKIARFPNSSLSTDLNKHAKNIFSIEEEYSGGKHGNEAYAAPNLLFPAWEPRALFISKSSKSFVNFFQVCFSTIYTVQSYLHIYLN